MINNKTNIQTFVMDETQYNKLVKEVNELIEKISLNVFEMRKAQLLKELNISETSLQPSEDTTPELHHPLCELEDLSSTP